MKQQNLRQSAKSVDKSGQRGFGFVIPRHALTSKPPQPRVLSRAVACHPL
jgi:hypothetical protein